MLTSGLIEEVGRGKSARGPSSSEEDERRRYYRLSPLGRRVLQLELSRLARVVVVARAKHLLTGPEPA
jgi:hypothetical protein